MNIFRLAFELFALYLLYKLIFDFIIPLANTTREVKKQFGDMSSRMQQMNEQQKRASSSFSSANTPKPATSPRKNDDYIEFEEVK